MRLLPYGWGRVVVLPLAMAGAAWCVKLMEPGWPAFEFAGMLACSFIVGRCLR